MFKFFLIQINILNVLNSLSEVLHNESILSFEGFLNKNISFLTQKPHFDILGQKKKHLFPVTY